MPKLSEYDLNNESTINLDSDEVIVVDHVGVHTVDIDVPGNGELTLIVVDLSQVEGEVINPDDDAEVIKHTRVVLTTFGTEALVGLLTDELAAINGSGEGVTPD